MAENAVYISSIEHSKPTIFEIWAEESFMATLQPAYQLLSDFISSKLPQGKCRPLKLIFEWPDESFLIFNIIMQSTYLDWFSASFSESFYGLKRVNVASTAERLTTRAKILSLIGLVGAPYIMIKFKSMVDNYVFSSSNEGQVNATGLKLLQGYKIMSSALRLMKLYHYVSYLSGHGSQHSIFHRLAGVQLVHQNQPPPSWADISTLIKLEPNRSKLIAPLTFKIVSQLFELGAFSLQFINWWNSMDSEVFKFNRTPIPEPIDSIKTGDLVCPICRNSWRVEVVLSTSGIVYCYSCITKVLNETGRCPVTDLPFSMNDLIRLYPAAC
uniref:Peroxisome assembly protein 12 n=2 Tax=Lygus hesperus TaxID=30085 RepID=A0A0A9XUL4_LYGHE